MEQLIHPSADYRSVAEEVPIKARLRALQSIVAGIYRLFGILDQVEKIGSKALPLQELLPQLDERERMVAWERNDPKARLVILPDLPLISIKDIVSDVLIYSGFFLFFRFLSFSETPRLCSQNSMTSGNYNMT